MRTIAFVLAIVFGNTLSAKAIFTPGDDLELDNKMLNHTRFYYLFHALPFGIGLNMTYKDEEALGLIKKFLGQKTSNNVKEITGFHQFDLLEGYEGYSGLGLRGGGAAISTAFRYMALKKEGADQNKLSEARKDVIRAIEALHVAHVITGGNGRMARGIQRLKPEDPDNPPIPGDVPKPIPLFDEKGNPLPLEKDNGQPRADNSDGILPEGEWIWYDSCSKDQLVGWIVAMATLYDAVQDDPKIDKKIIDTMREDARLIGKMLREKHRFMAIDGKEYEYDLVIMDADGRPTFHHDLNPKSFEKTYFPPDSDFINVFNMIMALGIVKGLYHVSNDPEAERYLYEELLGKRGYLDYIPVTEGGSSLDYIYMGAKTNFSNVNMIAIALFLNIYFENDQEVLKKMRAFMENLWWNRKDTLQSAINLKQPYFNALYLAMTDKGTDFYLVKETAKLLKAFNVELYLNEERINCDEKELQAKECIAVDEKTVLKIQDEVNHGGHPVAFEALDPSIRPPSDFDARTDPFEVNGGGGKRINPGGDLNSAYWMLRFLDEQKPGNGARSPFVRKHMPVGGWKSEAEAIQLEKILEETDMWEISDEQPISSETKEESDKDSGNKACMFSHNRNNLCYFFIVIVFLIICFRKGYLGKEI